MSLLPLITALLAMVPENEAALASGGHLRWQAAGAGCPDASSVAALVDQHLALREGTKVDVTVDAAAREVEGGAWSIALRIDTEQGSSTRSLQAADCAAAAETVALAVALAVGPAERSTPLEVPHAPEPEPEPEPGPEPEPEPARPDDPPADPTPSPDLAPTDAPPRPADVEPSRPRRLTARLGLGGGVTGGHVARVGAALLAYASLVGPRWELSLRADHAIRRQLRLPARPDAGGTLSLTTAGLQAGPVLRPGPLELPLLVGVTAGAVHARGFGSDHDLTRTVAWATVVLGPELRWSPVPRLVLGLRAEASLALVRHAFTLGPSWPLVSTGIAAGRALATVALRLP